MLRQLQHEFQDYLLNGRQHIASSIVGTPQAGVERRLGVYGEAYVLRLVEALESDFVALRVLLGGDFTTLCRDYIRDRPSSHHSLRYFGEGLSDFLAARAPYRDSPFLSELAAFEWALIDAFDAADGALVCEADMATVAPGDWPALQFVAHPSLQRLDLHYNAPAVWKAAEQGQESLPDPQHCDVPTAWIVWRKDLATYFRSLDVTEAWALDALRQDQTFAEICEGLCEWIDEANVPVHAVGLLKRWIQDGLIGELGLAP